MRVLIFEDIADGHHFVYVRHLAEALLARGARPVLATTREAARSAQFAGLLAPLAERLELSLFDAPPVSRLAARHLWRSLQLLDQIRRVRPGHVIVPYVDGMAFLLPALAPLARLARPRGCGVDALIMRVAPATSRRQRLKHRLLHALLAGGIVDRLHVIDELSHATLLTHAPRRLAARIRLTPDPVLDETPRIPREVARARLGLPSGRRLVLCIGLLSRRKGVARLVELACASDFPADTTLVLAGASTDEVRERLGREDARAAIADGRIELREGFVETEDFGAYFAAADVVTALYVDHHGSSGIVIQAASAERPVLAIDTGWIGHVVTTHGLGATCSLEDPASVREALVRLLEGGEALPDAAGRARFLAPRTLEAFERSFLEAVPGGRAAGVRAQP